MSDQKIGHLVDGHGVTLDLEDADLVSDVLVVAKVSTTDGGTTIAIGASDGMDWVTQLGLVAAASRVINTGFEQPE
jgi:cobalamin biosynthesis protein CbiD